MKKNMLFRGIIGISILLFLFFTLQQTNVPELVPIVDSSAFDATLQLHYTDRPPSVVKSFTLIPTQDHLVATKETFVPYTEGLIPKSLYKEWLSQVEAFCQDTSRPVPLYLSHYSEDQRWVILGFIGGPHNTFILDKETSTVRSLITPPEYQNTEIYPYHFQIQDDTLTLLGGKVNSYESLILKASLTTGEIISSLDVDASEFAIGKSQTALTPNDLGLFLDNKQLLIADMGTGNISLLPIDFQGEGILSTERYTIIYNYTASETLQYILLDHSLQLVQEDSLPLPSATQGILGIGLIDKNLYLVSAAKDISLFPNYIVAYNLSDNRLIYCSGLEGLPDFILSHATITIPSS